MGFKEYKRSLRNITIVSIAELFANKKSNNGKTDTINFRNFIGCS